MGLNLIQAWKIGVIGKCIFAHRFTIHIKNIQGVKIAHLKESCKTSFIHVKKNITKNDIELKFRYIYLRILLSKAKFNVMQFSL